MGGGLYLQVSIIVDEIGFSTWQLLEELVRIPRDQGALLTGDMQSVFDDCVLWGKECSTLSRMTQELSIKGFIYERIVHKFKVTQWHIRDPDIFCRDCLG